MSVREIKLEALAVTNAAEEVSPPEEHFAEHIAIHDVRQQQTSNSIPVAEDLTVDDDCKSGNISEDDPYLSSESDYIPSIESESDSEEDSYDAWANTINHMCNETPSTSNERSKTNVANETRRKTNRNRPLENSTKTGNEDDYDMENNATSIMVKSSEHHAVTGKMIRNKKHCCHLCQKIVCNLSRHLEAVHSEDTVVARILALAKNSRRRRTEFSKLLRIGDFYHNCEVLQLKKGELILLRRPTPNEQRNYTYINYGPCPDCLGFMLKKHIWIHVKDKCPERSNVSETNIENRKPLTESNAMLAGMFGAEISNDFVSNILNTMRDDLISQTCKEDRLILKFGLMIYQKYSLTQAELVRQSMRQLGRLLIDLKSRFKLNHLSECLKPQNFDKIVQSTKSICVAQTAIACRPEFRIPSLALKIGIALKKAASFERGYALRMENLRRNDELVSFLSLMDLEWNIRVSSNALNTLYKRKFNATQLLPLTADLVKLNTFIESEMKKRRRNLEELPSPTSWGAFAALVLSRIVLFNKRRSGETSRMTTDQYLMRPMWSEQTTEELKQSMTSFEKKLAEHLVIVEIEGKRGRKVPVILTPETKSAIDLLIKQRPMAGISKENPFVFARSQNSLNHLRGHDCIRTLCENANLQSPENINGTKLRKYVATVCQIFNLSENENDFLARHLGHDIRVHREFYRLHESAVELTKVSRLLLAVDRGEASAFAGKSLQDIEISDLPNIEEDDAPTDEEETVEENIEKSITDKNTRTVPSKMKPTNKQGPSSKKTAGKRPWSNEETEAVITFFRFSIKKENVPGKQKCEECKEKYPVLHSRTWTDIKFHVKNYIAKLKKTKK